MIGEVGGIALSRVRRALVAFGIASAAAITACGADGISGGLSGFVSDPPLSVAGLSLPDAANSDADFVLTPPEDSLLIVYFGYTACPDVCPTTMHEVEVALRQVGDLADRVDVAMVTIDPSRDEPRLLANYVHDFVPDGHALRTDDGALLGKVAAAFGASYSIATDDDGTVKVGHTPNLYAVDDTGTIVLTWPFGLPGSSIAADLELLLEAP